MISPFHAPPVTCCAACATNLLRSAGEWGDASGSMRGKVRVDMDRLEEPAQLGYAIGEVEVLADSAAQVPQVGGAVMCVRV
jgi:hypothetical protein